MKLIIDVSKNDYEWAKQIAQTRNESVYCERQIISISNGIPLDDDSERAEVQAYFAGQAYGWEEGRKALIGDLKTEIEKMPTDYCGGYIGLDKQEILRILDNIGKSVSGE